MYSDCNRGQLSLADAPAKDKLAMLRHLKQTIVKACPKTKVWCQLGGRLGDGRALIIPLTCPRDASTPQSCAMSDFVGQRHGCVSMLALKLYELPSVRQLLMS